MSKLSASTRLKVNRDTFFIPDPNGGVYFRNNLSSFRMEGSTIHQWIEKLLPMFNGEHSLGSLTEGLPEQYRNRIFEISEVLYTNGFARDVSKDRPHQLKENIVKNYASQIEFLNSFGESGAYRFQTYRLAKVLAIGSGSFFVSLVSALLESGLPTLNLAITDIFQTNHKRINDLVENARKTDSEIVMNIVELKERNLIAWKKLISSYDAILYVTEDTDISEITMLNAICIEEKKTFIPAICSNEIGMAGPVVYANSEGCFESAWRSIHEGVLMKDQQLQPLSSIAGAMLANLIVFELFKEITKSNEVENEYQFYLLNHDTLEGNWHTFKPHPIVSKNTKIEIVQDFEYRLEQNTSKGDQSHLFHYLDDLTSEESGIFHQWDEGNLKQLPLAQCSIQVIDPVTNGPAKLLSSKICSDLTHEEARRLAALTGIEMYASKLFGFLVEEEKVSKDHSLINSQEFIAISTGETFAECICRGLQKCLANELLKQDRNQVNKVLDIKITSMEDERCQFYLQALKKIDGEVNITLGEKSILGFPVVWVCSNDKWFRSVGLNETFALREALQQALLVAQNQNDKLISDAFECTSVQIRDQKQIELPINACNGMKEAKLLEEAIDTLKQYNMSLQTIEFHLEQFNLEGLCGIYGVKLREVQSS